jgi:hypothetical protein
LPCLRGILQQEHCNGPSPSDLGEFHEEPGAGLDGFCQRSSNETSLTFP